MSTLNEFLNGTAQDSTLDFAPPETICKIKAQVYKTKGIALRKTEEAKDVIEEIQKIKAEYRYGRITASIFAELTALAGSLVNQLVGEVQSLATKEVARLFGFIMQAILEVANLPYLLVAIPQEAAKEALNSEKHYLMLAKSNMLKIKYYINKWIGKLIPADYYTVLKSVNDYVVELSRDLQAMLTSIKTAEYTDFEFDSRLHNMILSNFKKTINGLKTGNNTIAGKLRSVIQAEEEREYREKVIKIKSKYNTLRRDAVIEYSDRTINLYTNEGSDVRGVYNKVIKTENVPGDNRVGINGKNSEALKGEVDAEAVYKNKLKNYNASEQAEIIAAKFESTKNVFSGESLDTYNTIITNKLKDLGDEFVDDMESIYRLMGEFSKNMAFALTNYKLSMTYVNNMIGIESMADGWYNFFLKAVQGTSFESLRTAAPAVATANGSMNVVKDKISKVKRGSFETANVYATVKTITDFAYNTYSNYVSDDLISIVNAYSNASFKNEKFEEYIGLLRAIKDFYGDPGWANEANLGNPDLKGAHYNRIISDINKVNTNVSNPIPRSNFADILGNLNEIFRGVDSDIDKLVSHNSIVNSTISSFNPGLTSGLEKVLQLLKSLDLLHVLALGQSLDHLLIGMIKTKDLELNIIDCEDAYEEIFDDEDIQYYLLKAGKNPAVVDEEVVTKAVNSHPNNAVKNAIRIKKLQKKVSNSVTGDNIVKEKAK